ncbi:MAG: hypothetical protein LUQ12_03595, partial [Methanoregulaceae archaeon]|nr:hypothetical protein [Methanoregulaceae archaeon]
ALSLKEKMPDNFAHIMISDDISQVENGQADAIIALDVLEHVQNIEPVLAILLQKLSRNGVLILSGPTETLWYSFLRKIAALISRGWFTQDYHHSDIGQLRAMIEKTTGLKALEIKSVPWFPPLFKILLYMKNDEMPAR